MIAATYLAGLGIGAPVYEPDGNIPPDFAVGGRIAVEVRRLNQNFENAGEYEGLEVLEASILGFMENLFRSFGPPTTGRSWFVFYSYRRPLNWAELKPSVRRWFRNLDPEATPDDYIAIGPRFEVRLGAASKLHATKFVLGGYSDRQAGGWVVSEVIRNANICVAEKARKIEAHFHRYDEWWLVLLDRISWRLDGDECDLLRQHIPRGPWAKIILLNPRDGSVNAEL